MNDKYRDKLKLFEYNSEEEYNSVVDYLESYDTTIIDIGVENYSIYTSFYPKIETLTFFRAIIFVLRKIRGSSVSEAYAYSHADIIDEIESKKVLNRKSNNFGNLQIVIELYKKLIIPDYLKFSNLRENAIDVLRTLMLSKKTSDRIKIDSATAILNATKVPEEIKVDIEQKVMINNDYNVIEELKNTMKALSENQSNMDTQAILEAKIIRDKIEERNND